nr:MAG: hypothetical protein [Lake Baikal virophage 9]
MKSSKINKTKDDFNERLQDVFKLMSIQGKYNIVGSSTLKGILYASDIDLNEKTKVSKKHPFEYVYDTFVDKFKKAKSNPNMYITDFKAGVDEKGEPIKWTYDTLLENKDLFIKCLHTKSMIKLDIIFLLNGVYVDITEVYFLQIGNFKTYDDKELDSKSILNELKKSYDECIKEKMYFKALKRLNSIMNMEHNNNKKKTTKITAFFNSQSGLLYKCYSDLQILLTLINNNFRKPPIQSIKDNLQIIKQMLSIQTETKQNVSQIIDNICKKKKLNEMFIYIDKLSIYLAKLFNRDAKSFMDSL